MERCAAQGEVWERSDYGIEIFDNIHLKNCNIL